MCVLNVYVAVFAQCACEYSCLLFLCTVESDIFPPFLQVIVGSFLPDGQREVATNYVETSSAQRAAPGGGAGASSSPSRGTLSESSGGPASPLNLSSGVYNNITQGMSGIPWK